MTLALLLIIPLLGAAVVMACKLPRLAVTVALGTGALEMVAIGNAVWTIHVSGPLQAGRYLRADALTAFFLINIGLIFALVLAYSVGYMRHIPEGRFSSPRWFYALVLVFLFTMIAVYLSANLGMLWIFVEGTTLASALLVGFYNTEGAVEAGWKYLIVCTVGIAFALFGTIALYLAAVRGGVSPETALDWAALMAAAPRLGAVPDLMKLAFVFVAVGYGTKVGFVPMHSWLPDAHAEAPSPISALLSAVLLNCAMYAVLRFDAIVSRAIGSGFSHTLLLVFGGMSITVAAFLMIVQRDLKRLLAYSSIEHMGIVAIGIGLGGMVGIYAALLHTFNHSIAKSLLFFGAGNVRESYGTLRIEHIRGMFGSLPWTSGGMIVGALAIVGLPPFGLFVSEFMILTQAFATAHYFVAVLLLAVLSVVFGALLYHFQHMLGGEREQSPAKRRFLVSDFAAMSACAVCLVVLGIRIPVAFNAVLNGAMAVLR
ncbi:MAG TPA: hydrogenase 4 subunit F [Terriglobales bacterium]|nr:hydrogenase 4 subunit F [Terriglobales bacterium]